MAADDDRTLISAAQAVADPELFDGTVTAHWLLAVARQGHVPSYKFGARKVRFRRGELRAFIDQSRRTAQAS
jgi:hypothetical protein